MLPLVSKVAPPSLQLDFIEPDHCEALQRHYIAAAEGKATKGFLMYETHRLGFSTSAIIVLAIDPWLDFTTPAKLHDINMVSTCFNNFVEVYHVDPWDTMGTHGNSLVVHARRRKVLRRCLASSLSSWPFETCIWAKSHQQQVDFTNNSGDPTSKIHEALRLLL